MLARLLALNLARTWENKAWSSGGQLFAEMAFSLGIDDHYA